MSDFYSALAPLLQMAWSDNFHFGYWDGPSDTSSVAEATDRFTDLLVARLRLGQGDRVLDVGCGIGKPALRIAATTQARVLGINISAEQVRQATEGAHAAGVADCVSFQYGDGMDTRLEPDSFDAVLALESIMHMDRPVALREMCRVLRPGGRLVLTDIFPLTEPGEALPFDTTQREGDAHIASLAGFGEWPGLVAAAGLELDELTDVTENIKGTFPRMLDGFLTHRRRFEQENGVSVEQVLAAATVTQPNLPAAGCLIMAAHKPLA
jgi:SAM-dependent methyltransferase